MPMFQTFADYDKWRRRQLLMRLESLKPAPDSIVDRAAMAGDGTMTSSTGLDTGHNPPSGLDDGPSPALRRAMSRNAALKGKISEALEVKVRGTGADPKTRDDVVMATHNGTFRTERAAQLTGLAADTDDYTLSFFINIVSQKSAVTTVQMGDTTLESSIAFAADGSLRIVGDDSDAAEYGDESTGANVLTVGQRHHIMVTASNALNVFKLWIDGTAVVDTTYGTAVDPLGNETNWYLMADAADLNGPDSGDQFGAYWMADQFVADPVGTFIHKAESNPIPLPHGTDGGAPTGQVPLIFFNEVEDWNSGVNQGTGGAFTVTSTMS